MELAYPLNSRICLYYSQTVEVFCIQGSCCMCGSGSLRSASGAHEEASHDLKYWPERVAETWQHCSIGVSSF